MDTDPFILFRGLLVTLLTVYATLALVTGAVQFWRLISGEDRHKRLLRTYLGYQLLSLRLRPVAGELTQIAAWTILLIIVWRLHHLV
ncbi:MAG: hypothetical protein LC135_13545 [Phycisphaerae bacterium]|nr:hypothetical protein [Phycisphaerae bacterium]MCZ2400875.1 hypothetical protein [Phycisphaerae bacterium]